MSNEPQLLPKSYFDVLHALAEARRLKEIAKDREAKAKKHLEESMLNKEYQEARNERIETETTVSSLEEDVRNEALSQFDGENKDLPGGKIKTIKSVGYNPDDAYKWALEHKLALRLDTSAFKKIVDADPDSFDFVTVMNEPKFYINSDLSEFIDEYQPDN